jgi:hypothetical protein
LEAGGREEGGALSQVSGTFACPLGARERKSTLHKVTSMVRGETSFAFYVSVVGHREPYYTFNVMPVRGLHLKLTLLSR